MPIQIDHRPDHDFTEPLGLLSDCHRRIEHFLDVLIAVETGAAGGALTAAERTALESAIRYFTVAAPKHTADEEASLFPRLRASRDVAAVQAVRMLDALEADHQEADKRHAEVERLVGRWLADDRLMGADRAKLHDHLLGLQTLYRRHIAIEDVHLFPSAAEVLTNEELLEIGREIAHRRNVVPLAR